ncbi:MAG: hypothetical protein ABL940_12995 [Bacteroidia bacterium]|jgi:hypothetical protein
MKKILNTLLAVALTGYSAHAAQIIIEGNYQGKNLYISNPYAGSGVGFCVYEVYVNDKLTTDEWNSSAFEVDFTNFSLKSGDKVVVRIKHKDDCKPKVLNPEVLKPKSTFEIVSMKVEKDGTMNWKAKGETGKLAYVVEQFRWNKWIKVTEVQGKGTDNADYTAKVVPHSGENKFRVKQVDFSGSPRYSEPVKFRSMSKEITFSPQKADKEVIFSDDTMFEVWDQYGNIVKKGSGAKVDVAGLQKGIYYLNFDNKTDKFVKK